MDETTFRDSNSFLITGKSFVVRYFPSTETTILVRTNSVPITQQELSQASNIDFAITTDGGINYGEIITSTNQFAPLGAPQQFSSNFVNSPQLQQTVLDTAKTVSGQSQPTPTAPNPDQQGGSTSVTQPTTGTEPTAAMLVYPEDLGSTEQDRIKFQAIKYVPRGLPDQSSRSFEPNKPKYEPADIPIFLPIQSAIIDQNNVGWEPDTLNPIELKAVQFSKELMTSNTTEQLGTAVGNQFNNAMKQLKESQQEVRTYLAGQAVGVNNLLSRLDGKVLNPNLELLFQGPQLRPFNFTFKMSARNRTEAVIIKKIIKYFKKNMSPNVGENALFLKAPNIFNIEYQKGRTSKHKSINLIKECALTNCSVDYTPLGSYMTYSDDESTMIAYTMTLSFQELTPVYDRDYLTGEGKDHPIGY